MEEHLTRLKLIGVMGGLARLSLVEIRVVLAVLDGPGSLLDSMSVMQNVLVGRQSREAESHRDDALDGPSEVVLVQLVTGTLLRSQLVDAVVLLARQHTTREWMAGE